MMQPGQDTVNRLAQIAATVVERESQGLRACGRCGYIGPLDSFPYGSEKTKAWHHPSHQACPKCSFDVTWHGFKRAS